MAQLKYWTGAAWVEVGPGVGVPTGGSAGQVLTKTSAADYATAWQTPTLPILANNTALRSYQVDGTTVSDLIKLDPNNQIQITPPTTNLGASGYLNRPVIYLQGQALVLPFLFVPTGNSYSQLIVENDGSVGGTTKHASVTVTAGGSVSVGMTRPAPVDAGKTAAAWYHSIHTNGSWALHQGDESAYAIVAEPNTRHVWILNNLNVQGSLLKGGVAYTHPDFVFEQAYRGEIRMFATAGGAADYQGLLPIAEHEAYTREHLRLPGPRGDKYDLFARGDMLLAEVEMLYLRLYDMNRRIADLEAR